ncbi:orotate phosphoribosyltransferase [Nanoarchaeota archaeon]
MDNFDQKEFNSFIVDNNVYGFFDKAITLKSGRTSHFYANWRIVVEDVWLADRLADYVIAFAKANNIEADTFYGVPEGATKIGLLSQYKSAKLSGDYAKGSHVLAMGRAKPKEHGAARDRYFVGMPTGKVAVIEDVTTTGGSMLSTLDSLVDAGVDVIGVISLTNRMEKRDDGLSVREAVEQKGFKFLSMSSSLDVLPMMYKKLQPGENIKDEIESEFAKYGVEELKLE